MESTWGKNDLIDSTVKEPKKYFLPFSPYQLFLFAGDLFLSSLSWFIFISLFNLRSVSLLEQVTISVVFSIPIITFLAVFRLYSYHIIYKTKTHLQCMLNALSWAFVCYCIIYLILDLPVFFSSYNIYYGLIFLVIMFIIALLGRLFARYLSYVILSIGTIFVTIGFASILSRHWIRFYFLHFSLVIEFFAFLVIILLFYRYVVVSLIFNKILRRFFRKQMLVIGITPSAKRIIEYIIRNNAPFWINGLLKVKENDHETKSQIGKSQFAGKSILGSVKDLPRLIVKYDVDELIITDKTLDKRLLISILDFSHSNGIVVWFPPFLLPIIPLKLHIDNFCGLKMIRMCMQRNPNVFVAVKRVMDLVLSSILLIVLSPLFIAIAIAIKLDSPGPVFYRSEVVGEGGRKFKMFKFRSMRTDADSSIHKEFVTKLIKGEINKKKAKILKITDDPRVTRVGKIIRRLSLDELPQLFNVLMGEMSLVGPRPCLPYEYELYKDWHRKRNSVKPGITGLWQIAGRSEVDFEEMILLDLYYIYNRNIFLDISILFETIFVVLGMKGAY